MTLESTDLDEQPPSPASGSLVLVSTPIGNLGDVSQRALEALRSANTVLCEDTRVTARLLSAYGISVATAPLHEHNEDSRIPGILEAVRAGKRIVLVSDAGTPVVSDPGFRLVRAAIGAGLAVGAVPGPNAAVMALVLSGLPPQPFMFIGFPPPRSAARIAAFSQLRAAERAGLDATLLWHEAPHRLAEMLADLHSVFGNRPAAVARELTKRFEEVRRAPLADLATYYAQEPARGEITVLVGPPPPESQDAENLDAQLLAALASSSVKDAAALVAGSTGLPRRVVYARALELSRG
ncbi:16S rRNA (cytidine(1402)-2'-O)-methyltransferase [Acidisphaera sp. L21]|uniref:16S rRNA (cytidine(1402)-2'-O)-methyltransferase n=1 Tax=Acidisphaera sp. L21 TaxID=1641851 RepID=UPI00131DD7BD|nr:16S rRNA (cytidine(1402)-2'-O)-methyltransferase [Acidisphaera sp. L21]